MNKTRDALAFSGMAAIPFDPARRALLKSLSLGAGGVLLTKALGARALAAPPEAPVFEAGWLLSRADLDGKGL